jgi:2'-5' RNA ligase
MTIRSFIALPIPKETANELGDIAAKMSYQDKSNAVKWVDQENYHITLAFLGEQRESDLELLAEQLDAHLNQHEFLLNLSHLSPFPETKPKLLAAMVEKKEDIVSVQKQVISSAYAAGLVFDKRKFIPHLTLGRYRHTRNHYAGTIPMNVSYETFIDEVVLYQSTLTNSGAEYEPIFRFPLDQFDVEFDSDDLDYNDLDNHEAAEYLADEV